MKRCPYCGEQNEDDSLFCTECGKPIPQGVVCPHCGASVDDDDVFCSNCGRMVGEQPLPEIAKPLQKKCPHCGASVDDDDLFCCNCGRTIDEQFTPDTSNNKDVAIGNVITPDVDSEENIDYGNNILKYTILGILVIVLLGLCWWLYDSSRDKTDGDNVTTESVNVAKTDTLSEQKNIVAEEGRTIWSEEEIKKNLDNMLKAGINESKEDIINKYFSTDFRKKYNKFFLRTDEGFFINICFWSRTEKNCYVDMKTDRIYDIEDDVAYADVICTANEYVYSDGDYVEKKYEVTNKAKLVYESGRWLLDDFNDWRKFMME